MSSSICATHTAPTNIAVVKYWGKLDVGLNTPINSRCVAVATSPLAHPCGVECVVCAAARLAAEALASG